MIHVAVCIFIDEVEDPLWTEHIIVIWSGVRIKLMFRVRKKNSLSVLASAPPRPPTHPSTMFSTDHSKAVPLLKFFYDLVSMVFHMLRFFVFLFVFFFHYLFVISSSLVPREGFAS